MSDPGSHSTLREMRHHLTQPVPLAALAGASLVLALVGPYGTGDHLRLVPRLGYWTAIVFATYAAGFVVHDLMARRAGLARAARLVLGTLGTSLAVAVIVALINGASFGDWIRLDELPLFLLHIAVISGVVSGVLVLAEAQAEARPPAPATAPATPAPPPILDRLPFDKRGALLALSSEDHYVRIRTTRGNGMVLLRLSDAMKETGSTPGLQVHRSHWVALPAVAAARRDGDRAVLTLTDGHEIPASRRYVPALRDAGLLPR